MRRRIVGAILWALVLGLGRPPGTVPAGLPGPRTVPGQTLTGRTVWEGDVRVTGPVAVPAGAVLIVRPGTRVFFDLPEPDEIEPGAPWILVEGGIRVEGTPDRPVWFTATPARVNGFENMIDVRGGPPAEFRYAVFTGGPWGIHLHDTPALVEGCVFRGNYGGVRFKGGPVTLRGNRFEGNRIGVRLWKASPVLRNNVFTGNLTGIFFREAVRRPVIKGNLFDDREYDIKLGELQVADVDATGNRWAVPGSAALPERIFDGADSEGVGRVLLEPHLFVENKGNEQP